MRQHSFPDARVCMGCGPTPTAHSGLLAVRDAARRLGTRDLSQCEVYSTATPCAMRQGALYWARVRRGYSPRARWSRGSSQGSDVECLMSPADPPKPARCLLPGAARGMADARRARRTHGGQRARGAALSINTCGDSGPCSALPRAPQGPERRPVRPIQQS